MVKLERDGDRWVVRAARPGLWRGAPAAGQVLVGGQSIGVLAVLGRRHRLSLPAEAGGRIIEVAGTGREAEVAVAHGTVLLILDSEIGGLIADAAIAAEAGAEAQLVFRSPSSGRFYSRPAPDRPPFVAAGDEIGAGDTVCMLEVMKTFSRIAYAGDGLPARARVAAVVPSDGDDLDRGDIILELQPLSAVDPG
jgi:acetyl-CoA carboxylase biotin carboxyl carrier protein